MTAMELVDSILDQDLNGDLKLMCSGDPLKPLTVEVLRETISGKDIGYILKEAENPDTIGKIYDDFETGGVDGDVVTEYIPREVFFYKLAGPQKIEKKNILLVNITEEEMYEKFEFENLIVSPLSN